MISFNAVKLFVKSVVSPKGAWFQVSIQQIKMNHHNSLSALPVFDLQVMPYAIARELTHFIQTLSSEHQVRPRSDIQIISPGQKDHPPPLGSHSQVNFSARLYERKKKLTPLPEPTALPHALIVLPLSSLPGWASQSVNMEKRCPSWEGGPPSWPGRRFEIVGSPSQPGQLFFLFSCKRFGRFCKEMYENWLAQGCSGRRVHDPCQGRYSRTETEPINIHIENTNPKNSSSRLVFSQSNTQDNDICSNNFSNIYLANAFNQLNLIPVISAENNGLNIQLDAINSNR